MHKLNRALSGLLVAAALVACQDALQVTNTNNPDRARVLARPTDLEALIKGTFKTTFNGTYGTNGVAPSARTIAWEHASALNNFGMGPRSSIPRQAVDNSRSNTFYTNNEADFNALQRAARAAADGIHTIPLVSLGSAQLDARGRAFAWFGLGVALGYVSMVYDSAAIPDPFEDLGIVPDLFGYADVYAAALAALDSAKTWSDTARVKGYLAGTMLTSEWLNGATYTADEFIRLIRSYKAYFRANVARTPADRAAVNWTLVRDDALAGITATISISTGAGSGWTATMNAWQQDATWNQFANIIAGMADSTVTPYEAWLATPDASKDRFLVRTPDLRFPSGDIRATQNTNSPTVPSGRLYVRNNAPGLDVDARPWNSQYSWYRMQAWVNNAGGTGPFPFFPKAMNDLLLAEAQIRLGNLAAAATLIDLTRTTSGLPALSTGAPSWVSTATATTPGPGGNACVPHIPQSPAYTTTACGNIMEMMKWEYRMETMYVSYGSQWFSSRGWGDLPEGTPIHWPVPYGEMDTRQKVMYNLGGVGREGGSVGKGNYGY
jgi:hypothetical protein